jgi:hypothetical protein
MATFSTASHPPFVSDMGIGRLRDTLVAVLAKIH